SRQSTSRRARLARRIELTVLLIADAEGQPEARELTGVAQGHVPVVVLGNGRLDVEAHDGRRLVQNVIAPACIERLVSSQGLLPGLAAIPEHASSVAEAERA